MAVRFAPPPVHLVLRGRKIAYREYGAGPRVVVLTHGLLMDNRMYARVAPAIAAAGNRVITVDMLGHGEADQPHDKTTNTKQQNKHEDQAQHDHQQVPQA